MANEPLTQNSSSDQTPARYVRTFAQDVARLSGKPLPVATPAPSAPPPALVTTPPPKKERAYEPPPGYVIPKAPTTNESREDVLARLRRKAERSHVEEALVMPAKAPSTKETRDVVLARLKAQQQPVVAPKKVEPRTPVPDRIRTYKSDFAEHLDKKDASAFSVLAAQADAGVSPQVVVFKEKKPFPTALVAGILLFILGGGGLYAAYHVVTNRPMVTFLAPVPSLIVPDERRELVETSARGLLEELARVATEPLSGDAIRITYTSTATTSPDGIVSSLPQTGGALIQALALPMPDILLRSIQSPSTVGVIGAGSEQRVFFLLRVDSYERSFAGMLQWESTLAFDLSLLYPVPISSSTSTPTTLNPSFVDEVIANRDVRVLRDSTGTSVILYGFYDKETLIIARNEHSYRRLIDRLSVSQGQ